jgi:hypothetical protein
MQWVIQNSIGFAALENNCLPLLRVLEEMDLPIFTCGITEDQIVTGLAEIDLTLPTMFYGSTLLPKLISGMNFKPGIFWNESWWDLYENTKTIPVMLNQNIESLTFGDLFSRWIDEPKFIKSQKVKTITGQVIEIEEKDQWIEEHQYLDLNDTVYLCPIHKIEREWRFWILNGKLITGSLYKKFGCRMTREPIDSKIWDYVQNCLVQYTPSNNIVMDVAQFENGDLKIIEFNSINSSGFYNADIKKIVETLENEL